MKEPIKELGMKSEPSNGRSRRNLPFGEEGWTLQKDIPN